jgi:hypothetical protein
MSRLARGWPFLAGFGVRLAAIALVGFLMVLWFQGCLVPVTRDELRQEHERHGAGQPQ